MRERPRNLVGYCGLYCGACGIRQGRVRQAVENLRKVTGAYGIDKNPSGLAKWEPAFQHYAEFEKVMDGLVKIFGECPGCIAGGGDPSCAVRECCRQRGYTTCADCAEMEKCAKLRRYVRPTKILPSIKALGVEKWAEEMQSKVDAGYCYLDET